MSLWLWLWFRLFLFSFSPTCSSVNKSFPQASLKCLLHFLQAAAEDVIRQKQLMLESLEPTPMSGRSRRCSIIRSKMLHKMSTMKSNGSIDGGGCGNSSRGSAHSLMSPDEIENGVDGSINLKGI